VFAKGFEEIEQLKAAGDLWKNCRRCSAGRGRGGAESEALLTLPNALGAKLCRGVVFLREGGPYNSKRNIAPGDTVHEEKGRSRTNKRKRVCRAGGEGQRCTRDFMGK